MKHKSQPYPTPRPLIATLEAQLFSASYASSRDALCTEKLIWICNYVLACTFSLHLTAYRIQWYAGPGPVSTYGATTKFLEIF